MDLLSKFKSKFSKIALSFSLLLGTLAGVVGVSGVGYAASREAVSGSLSDPKIGLSYERSGGVVSKGTTSWEALGTTISGSVTGHKALFAQYSEESTLSIQNLYNVSATLTYAVSQVSDNGGSHSISASSGTVLNPQGTCQVTIKSKKGENTTSIKITNVALTPIYKTTVFQVAEGGSYSVNNETITSETTKNNRDSYQLLATPSTSYDFVGWRVNGVIVSSSNPYSYAASSDATVIPVFSNGNSALFSVGGVLFSNLSEAVSAAVGGSDKNILVYKSGDVSKGEFSIPNGVTLVVPMDDAGTKITFDNLKTYTKDSILGNKNTLFRKLTLEAGCSIQVESGGAISVCSEMYAGTGGGYAAVPKGPYGQIDMAEGSQISLNSGANLYCWGFITGTGKVIANDGSNVYEMFQIGNWRGGTATSTIVSNSGKKVFPFNQYYIQNIEAPLYMYKGATETCAAAVSVKAIWGDDGIASNKVYLGQLTFIGSDNKGMFRLTDGYLIKKYHGDTDRLSVDVYGSGTFSSVDVELNVTVSSGKFVLPITSNIDIGIWSQGSAKKSEITMNQDFAFLPGSKLTLGENTVLNVFQGTSIYLYNGTIGDGQWDKYAGAGSSFNSVPFAPTKKYTRTEKDLKNATFDVNGDLKFLSSGSTNSYGYMTTAGVSVISSKGTGTVQFAELASATTTYQYNQTQNPDTKEDTGFVSINVVQLTLQNGDGTFYEPVSSDANSTIVYYEDKWMPKASQPTNITVTFINAFGETYVETSFKSNLFIFPSETTVKNAGWSHYSPIFLWKNTSTGELFEPQTRVTNPNFDGKTFEAFMGGWITDQITNKTYFYEAADNFGKVTGLYRTASQDGSVIETYYFDTKGVFNSTGGEIVFKNPADGETYFIDDGVVQYNFGLYRKYDLSQSNASQYYYFGENGYAYKSGTYHLSSNKLNGYLAEGSFTFDSNGVLTSFTSDASFSVGEGGSLNNNVFTLDGVKVGVGLFTLSSDNHVYYAKDDGSIAKNETIYVTKTNGIKDSSGNAIEEGLYWFDASGYMFDASYQTMQKGA